MSHHTVAFFGSGHGHRFRSRYMVGKAQSQRKQQKEYSDLKDKWMGKAIEWCQADHNMSEHSSRKPRTLRDCCQEAEDECYRETKKTIKLSKSTLLRRVDGGCSIREFNAYADFLLAIVGSRNKSTKSHMLAMGLREPGLIANKSFQKVVLVKTGPLALSMSC